MPLPPARPLSAVSAAVVAAVGLLAVLVGTTATPASADDVATAQARVAALQARVDDVAAQLTAATAALERSQTELAGSVADAVAAERAAEASAAQRVAAGTAVRRVVLARYTDPVPAGLRLLSGPAGGGATDALAGRVLLARVQDASADALHAANAAVAQADADAGTLAARRSATSELARRTEAERQAVTELADRTQTALLDAAARLVDARQVERDRAAAAAAAAAVRAGNPDPVVPWLPTAAGPPCSGTSTGAYANGFVPDAALCPLATAPRHRLQADAARAFDAMSRAHAAETGTGLCLTDSYRSYPEQVRLFKVKPGLAAVPGTSNHGRGLAVDLCGGVERFDGAAHVWMAAHAATFGWVHPAWAEPGGGRPEPWHWEYGRL